MSTGSAFGTSVTVKAAFADTVTKVRAALARQEFGVLTEIDVQATMLAKLGERMDAFVILGACNPPLAHRALTLEPSVGQLLPCNVVVRSVGKDVTVVEVVDPMMLVTITGNAELEVVAKEAASRLSAALAEVAGDGAEAASLEQPVGR